MKLLKLTKQGGGLAYVDPLSILMVSEHKNSPGSYLSLTGDGQSVTETPEQIFDLIHNITGEPVTWYFATPDADPVDTAIDEAYQRGYSAALAEVEELWAAFQKKVTA